MMDGAIKNISQNFPTGEILFFRNLFALPAIIGFIVASGGLRLKSRHWKGHIVRGLFGVTAMYLYFLSYRLLPLSDAIALGLSGPIFLTVLSIPILGEKVGLRRWSAIITGFLGVLLMTKPGTGILQLSAFVPIAAATFYALAMITIRRLSDVEPSNRIVFYFTLFATLVALSTSKLDFLGKEYVWVWPRGWEWGWVVLIGSMGGIGQLLITHAFRLGPVSLVAPFDYMALVYGCAIGYFWFSEIPDLYLIGGGFLVVASGVYILHRETVVARRMAT